MPDTMTQLREDSVKQNPIDQFLDWFQEANDAGLPFAEAMTLSTVGIDAKPSARLVLLKGCDDNGFVFYTNYNSRKAKELDANPNAALTFFWVGLKKQVRIEGAVQKTTSEQSDEYFKTRPRGSQIGAAASPQSEVIPNREELEQRAKKLIAENEGKEIGRPAHWGGYILKPERIEFWQDVPDRLHDRLLFTLQTEGKWIIERLAP